MEITRALQELAKFSNSAFPVFSVYLNTQGDEPSQRDRCRPQKFHLTTLDDILPN